MSVLFQPTLTFLERVVACLPAGVAEGMNVEKEEGQGTRGAGGGSMFLAEFVVRVYLPQLEEKVSSLFHQAVGGEFTFTWAVAGYMLMFWIVRCGCLPRGWSLGKDIRATSRQS